MIDEKEEIQKLLDHLKVKRQRIAKEDKKRIIMLILTAVIDFSVVGLQLLKIVPVEVSLTVILVMLITSLLINHMVYCRIQDIIWSDYDYIEKTVERSR